jgi:hypothetical protein
MRAVAPVFQVYRFGGDAPVWWRMVSPNGRGLARTVAPFESVAAAHLSIDVVRRRIDELEPSLRLTERARWRWSLSLEGQRVAHVRGARADRADRSRRARVPGRGRCAAARVTGRRVIPSVPFVLCSPLGGPAVAGGLFDRFVPRCAAADDTRGPVRL